MGGPRHRQRIRVTRPTALLGVVATLFAALLICTGSADHPRTTAATDATAATGMTLVTGAGPGHPAEAAFVCPYDPTGCSLFPHLSPAVLTVPPPAAPLGADVQPVRLELPHPDGRSLRSCGAPARAPDLHVLQVLRT